MLCLNRATLLHTFGILLFFGIGKFSIGASWIYEGLITLGNIAPSLATALVAAFVLFYSLFFAFTLTIVKFWIGATVPLFRRSEHLAIRSLPLCAGWLVFEQANYLTALDTSFPWLDIGYAFADTWIAGLATIGGITLVSLGVLVVAAGLLMIASMPRLSVVFIGLPWIAGALALQQEWTEADGQLDVALVQANVSLQDRFSEDGLKLAWSTHIDLTVSARQADLIIWPEGSIPIVEHRAAEQLQLLAKQLDTNILLGIYIEDANREDQKVHNGAVAIEPLGRKSQFLKYKRVPFGEYTPFEWIFEPIQSGMNIPNSNIEAGPLRQSPLSTDCCTMGVSICYEIAFPYLIGRRAKNTDFLVAMSEDGWFGNSLGPAQHMQIARMRAIETQRYVVRATSSGITGIVNPKGKLVESLPANEPGVLTSTIDKRTGSTPFMFVAGIVQGMFDGFFLVGIMTTIALAPVATRLRRNRATSQV